MSSSEVIEVEVEVSAERRPWENGKVEVVRSAVLVVTGKGDGSAHAYGGHAGAGVLAHDAAHGRAGIAEVRPRPPIEPGRAAPACSQAT